MDEAVCAFCLSRGHFNCFKQKLEKKHQKKKRKSVSTVKRIRDDPRFNKKIYEEDRIKSGLEQGEIQRKNLPIILLADKRAGPKNRYISKRTKNYNFYPNN